MNKKHNAEAAPAQSGENHYPNCPDCGNNKHVKPYYWGGFRCTLCNRDFERVAPAPRGQHEPDYTGYGSTIRALKDAGYSLGSNNDLWWMHGGDHIATKDGRIIVVADLITQLLADNQALKSQVQQLRDALNAALSSAEYYGADEAQEPWLIQARTALANPKEVA